ncbi:MAG: phosphatase PAP2 family protein [SAR86 cluster bacterium]|uniref:undecaprenyl-diphosphate phosphatase n=1 Tax=SAR86 cluster bacterium TaxID=2030880 RepID=A0A937LLL8_9GAMM|nr:phosphatase PAP2 family protein [SAR86 cluster bacterium]
MMKTRTRNFLLALTIVLISLKLFPALDLYALKFLNKLFFDERTFAVITDMGNAFFITAFIIPALIGYSNFNSKINSVSASILVIPSLVFGLFIQLVKNLVNAPRPAGVGDININFLEPVFQSNSFPSGHTASIFIVCLIWLKVALTNTRGYQMHYFVIVLCALVVSLTRVIVGAHWLSDVLASILFAWLFAELFLKHFLKINKSKIAVYSSWGIILSAWYGVFFMEVFDYI